MRKLSDILRDRERADLDDRPTRSRSDARRAGRSLELALEQLVGELVELRPAQLNRLALPEEALDAVRDAQAITTQPARKRQLRLVRLLLRDADWATIRAQLDELAAGQPVPTAETANSEAVEWAYRLLGEGDAALEQLLEQCPSADRSHVRQLVRAVRTASGPRRDKARQKLTATVAGMLRR